MTNSKVIPIGADHAGFKLKETIKKHFKEQGYSFKDYGTHSEDSIDYPDFGHPVAEHVSKDKESLGIVICGSGNGINMTVNKHQDIRSALCWNEDLAALARQHNDANIIALPARFIDATLAIKMVDKFLTTQFEGGRHQNRVNKIACGD
ncbi:ribose 5-phosphate isomerase B [Brumimicrobium salinarum]|uniref:Ribose 5-phosphate isomerase B n=1 Tax=Brumimicrobium salinarum TaxID=2058658 RepID=A0A2I0R675_9FLAO|nr:ribose 5-phosphate isomerase B [Brumimicrobium salinarum]PKR82092.1 ribose 5-phosphate isomerase B [Brumimicrobium salinarum]